MWNMYGFRSCRPFFNAVFAAIFLFLSSKRHSSSGDTSFMDFSIVPSRRAWKLRSPVEEHVSRARRRTAEVDADLCKYDNTSLGNSGAPISTELSDHKGRENRCEYLLAHPDCSSQSGFIDYLRFFYCDCSKLRVVGYGALVIWLAALFYMLGNTAADYFCCSLERLSHLWNLPPTVAGVSLLPLGNGAPDFFASTAAFMGKNASAGDVGLNSVLGGAVFVTCIVVGTVSLCVSGGMFQIEKKSFIRDVCFFLVAIAALAIILLVGRISICGAVFFVSIYVLYAVTVAANEILRKHVKKLDLDVVTPLLHVRGSVLGGGGDAVSDEEEGVSAEEVPHLQLRLPQWMWASNVAMYSRSAESPPWGWKQQADEEGDSRSRSSVLLSWMELPLSLPRKLTIPVVEEGRWSKGYAVASVFFAPILLAFLWSIGDRGSGLGGMVTGIALGCCFGVLAFAHTVSEEPPRRCLLPWVLAGFVMSIVWFYIVANELVALLVSLGIIFGVSPSLLGLTVLAWGNSMGDLMSNVALAVGGGADGVQIAFSGCYAGPLFNTVVGLGMSMLLRSLSDRPHYVLPRENTSLLLTLGFLVFAIVWSFAMLSRNAMRPTKFLGIGLILIYFLFLTFRLTSDITIMSSSSYAAQPPLNS